MWRAPLLVLSLLFQSPDFAGSTASNDRCAGRKQPALYVTLNSLARQRRMESQTCYFIFATALTCTRSMRGHSRKLKADVATQGCSLSQRCRGRKMAALPCRALHQINACRNRVAYTSEEEAKIHCSDELLAVAIPQESRRERVDIREIASRECIISPR